MPQTYERQSIEHAIMRDCRPLSAGERTTVRVTKRCDMRSPSWPIPFTRKKILCLVLIGLAIEAIYLPFALKWLLVKTDYARGFTKEAFLRVKPGDAFTNVTFYLGPPLSYRVVDEVGCALERSSDISTLFAWQTNGSVVIHLQYSRPKSFKGNYQAWEVLIRGGVVKETRMFTYWD